MDFFSQQDRARGTTRTLVILFACAVLALILMASLLVYGLLFYTEAQGQGGPPADMDFAFLATDVFVLVALGVLAVVGLGSLFRLAQLRGGGKAVAESMRGRLINLNTRDANERKALNVVEEMSIASGVPVPAVYLIDDPAINAFAAGYQPGDAVIGLTRGCIEQLDRDELQGVIAHEFSHIFNGDMRLNIRLIGLLYGIMVLGLIGYFLMRGGIYSYGARRNRRGGIVMLGLGLVVIGYGGTFFGNLIKAAVSRQREFLADASAVQYTRNPDGIAGALKKIGGFSEGSKITHVDTREISHMLFEEGRASGFSGLLATHPPLDERIRRIEPAWQGGRPAGPVAKAGGDARAAGFSAGASALDAVGNPGQDHLDEARRQLESLPPALRDEVHSTLGACAAMYALVICAGGDEAVAASQRASLREELDPGQYRALGVLLAEVETLPRERYLCLVELALPALKQLSEEQFRAFMSLLTRLMLADQHLSLLEWSLFRILRHNLDPRPPRGGTHADLGRLRPQCEVLLSVLAAAGHGGEEARREAFGLGAGELGLQDRISWREDAPGDLEALDRAVDGLRRLKPLQKPRLLKAMARCIDADGKVTPEEAELLQAVGSLLDCPIPPVLAGQRFF